MGSRASFPYSRLTICGVWVALTLIAFLWVGASSLRSVLYLIAAALVPPSVFLGLSNDGPPPTVAEILHETEIQR